MKRAFEGVKVSRRAVSLSGGRRHALRRGAAMVEALVAIVFFTLIYWSIVYVGRLNEARSAALVEVRGCAWSIAVSGCGEVPARCRGSSESKLGQSARLQKKFEPVTQDAPTDSGTLGVESQSALNEQIDGLLYERIRARRTRSVRRPPLYGGGTVEVAAEYTLPCNSRPTSVRDLVEGMWNAATN